MLRWECARSHTKVVRRRFFNKCGDGYVVCAFFLSSFFFLISRYYLLDAFDASPPTARLFLPFVAY